MFNTQEADLSLDNWSKSQSSKRLKPSIKLHSAEFYNSLSKVWLTRRALKELDRRTNQVNSLQQSAFTPRCFTRNISDKIRTFAEDGGPDLREIRGYPAPTDIDLAHAMSSSRHPQSSSSRQSKSTASTSNRTDKRSSAYDNDFEQHLVDHRIYMNNRKSKPAKSTELHQILTRPRLSLSSSRFSDDAFEDFRQKNEDVIEEGEVMRDVIPIICGNAGIPSKQNLLFTRLDPIANNTTVNAKPDFYDGARLEDIDKQVRDDLRSFIIPTGHRTAPVAPNFFLEVKAPKGGADVAKRQACYDGALGARAMHKLQSYKQDEPIYDGNAYTITSTYHDGQLKIYTTHPTQAEDGTTEYHMFQLRSLALTDTSDSFRQGATVFRNARDYAQEQRDAFISAANERARSSNAESFFEASGHNDASDPIDVENATYLTQAKNTENDPQYYMSQQVSQEEYINNEPSDFTSNYNDLSDTTEVQRAEESELSAEQDGANGPSGTTDTYLTEESETSSDELALDIYSTPTISNKRRNRRSEKTVFKVPRKSDGRSERRGSKR